MGNKSSHQVLEQVELDKVGHISSIQKLFQKKKKWEINQVMR